MVPVPRTYSLDSLLYIPWPAWGINLYHCVVRSRRSSGNNLCRKTLTVYPRGLVVVRGASAARGGGVTLAQLVADMRRAGGRTVIYEGSSTLLGLSLVLGCC